MIFFIALGSIPVSAKEPMDDFSKNLIAFQREAYYHFFLEDYLTSATRLKLMEEKSRNNTEVLNETRLLLGSLYLAWGMHRPATAIFNELVTAFPPGNDRNRILLLIEQLQYSRNLHQAVVDTYALLAPDNKFVSMDQASYIAGMSHYTLGSVQEGIKILNTIPHASPYAPFGQLALAKSYTRLEDFEEATHLLNSLGEITSQEDPILKALSEKSRLTLGLLWLDLKQYERASSVLTSIPVESPFYPDALFGIGWAHFYREQYPEALQTFEQLIQTAPGHPYSLEALTLVGHCYNKLGSYQAAYNGYQDALNSYSQREQTITNLRQLIQNQDRLATLLQNFDEVQKSPLGSLLEDDGLRFWVKQYGELARLETYLALKRNDMGVFQVMVDHRESVFRDRLPTVQQFLEKDPVSPIQEKGRLLQNRMELAVRNESVVAFSTLEEKKFLDQLADAKSKSESIKTAINDPKIKSSNQNKELEDQWQAADRWRVLFQGEFLWKIITEIPGRSDDLRREVGQLDRDIQTLIEGKQKLIDSVPTEREKFGEFRKQIEQIQTILKIKQSQLTELRERLLAPLQGLLLKALDQKMGHLEALAATARLSQIQIMDFKSGS
jgi:tetratricopeptide (TPR) repeat protein